MCFPSALYFRSGIFSKKNVTPVKRARASSLSKGRVSGAGEF